ncbi:uncharacterized protein LOC108260598 [Ictalurus punctatus]|uniref:Uncharacterized protein LOC108260598 n=1 Tax=Ictalurus punctatus TaxID=7998 RepID=A0A9F7RBF9_ICTPU|nr:uncharacterized protein LOC108260598 [Ictalurus punctatus]
MVINSFRNGSIVTNSTLEFTANGTIPTNSTVQDALVNATNTTSSLNIIPTSINVTQDPVTNNSSTNTSTNSTSTNTSTNSTTNTSSTNTTSTNTTNTPAVAAAFNLVFSINETFYPALANISSPNFTAKAQSIRNQIEPVYRKIFNNFIRMVINSFRNGSILTNCSLEFSSNGTIPTVSLVKEALLNATSTTSSLNIIPSSINVTQTFGNSTSNSTSNSPVIASSLSMIWMSLLSLLLSVALHF